MDLILYPFAVYGRGVHDAIMRELEVGRRVTVGEEDEALGFGPLFDRAVEEDIALHPDRWGM